MHLNKVNDVVNLNLELKVGHEYLKLEAGEDGGRTENSDRVCAGCGIFGASNACKKCCCTYYCTVKCKKRNKKLHTSVCMQENSLGWIVPEDIKQIIVLPKTQC